MIWFMLVCVFGMCVCGVGVVIRYMCVTIVIVVNVVIGSDGGVGGCVVCWWGDDVRARDVGVGVVAVCAVDC